MMSLASEKAELKTVKVVCLVALIIRYLYSPVLSYLSGHSVLKCLFNGDWLS